MSLVFIIKLCKLLTSFLSILFYGVRQNVASINNQDVKPQIGII